VLPAIRRCVADPREKVHFVTHSLGGIVVRQLLSTHAIANVGRVVMLSPPNHGSEVVDKLGDLTVFDWLNGPAGRELSTQPGSTPLKLGPADFEVGIITGVSSINPILSMMIPGEDDGKVAVKNAQLAGMKDFLLVRCSHPLIMKSERVITQTLRFLNRGSFEHGKNPKGEEAPGNCWS
jgi:pimeloyl-ACP methyl ester carboxylesterase